ncbi:MAG: hypothetical protein ABI859_09810 [Pseudomonadota bacterium]
MAPSKHTAGTRGNPLIAGMFAFQPAQLLDLPKPEMREAPKVSFG